MSSKSGFALLALASTAFAWVAVFDRAVPGCIADNCLRAVTGTAIGQKQTASDRIGDCSSFLRYTVSPDTATITTVATSIATLTESTTTTTTLSNGAVAKRAATFTPSDIPAYASPCSGTARYSSACSCAGARNTVVTAATSSATVTRSTTFTTTSTTTSISTATVPAGPCYPGSDLATFYRDADFAGPTYEACGAFRSCINVPDDFARQASSLHFHEASSCTLYSDTDCTGDEKRVSSSNENFYYDGDFNDRLVSYICSQ